MHREEVVSKRRFSTRESVYSKEGIALIAEIFPIGIFYEVYRAREDGTEVNWGFVWAHLVRGHVKALRTIFAGYLAEPNVLPGKLIRGGHGWTRKRALRNLQRKLNKS